MKQTLYGDVLFAVNFSMDFLTLYVTAVILHRRVAVKRMAIAAALGGVYGVASCFMGGWLLFRIAVGVAVSVLLCAIAYEGRLLPCFALFYGVSFLLGGVMTAAYSLLNRLRAPSALPAGVGGGGIPLGWMGLIALLTAILTALLGRWEKRQREARSVSVTLSFLGKTVTLTGLSDSGNLLTDPIAGLPVMILSLSAAGELLPASLFAYFSASDPTDLSSLSPDDTPHIRLIPCHTVGGAGLLPAFSPSAAFVDGKAVNTVVAVDPTAPAFGGNALLVPSVLC